VKARRAERAEWVLFMEQTEWRRMVATMGKAAA